MKKVTHEVFKEAVSDALNQTYTDGSGRKRFYSEQVFIQDDYSTCVCILSKDGRSGVAVTHDGELISLFSYSRRKRGKRLVRLAVRNGATRLNCYDEDNFLPQFYGKFGFKESARELWNPEYAPDVWNGNTPDVVWMRK
jgi:hypothetical protein